MPAKKEKGEVEKVPAGKAEEENGEFKTKENLKIKEALKKR